MSVAPPSMDDDLRAALGERLRRANQRVTANRAALVDALAGAERPLTIPEILETGDELAQSSVYRNLVVLESVGIVHRVVTGDEHARYEIAEDLTGHHHHHLVCTSCGSVEDVPAPARLERAVADAIAEIEEATGFRAEDHRVDIVGRCADCA